MLEAVEGKRQARDDFGQIQRVDLLDVAETDDFGAGPSSGSACVMVGHYYRSANVKADGRYRRMFKRLTNDMGLVPSIDLEPAGNIVDAVITRHADFEAQIIP